MGTWLDFRRPRRSPGGDRRVAWLAGPTRRTVLLGCGIASSVLYLAADLVGSLRYPGYRWLDQEFSELTAQGAPTRPFMIALVEVAYNLLVLALAGGMWTAAGPRQRRARLAAAGLVGYAAFGFAAGTVTPMASRDVMAAGEDTLRNAFHGPLTLASDLCLAVGMAVAGQLLGKRFRSYAYATVATLVVAGAVTSVQIPRMEANRPTPWMGLEERVNIYATMLWVAVLAVGLLRAEATESPRHLRACANRPVSPSGRVLERRPTPPIQATFDDTARICPSRDVAYWRKLLVADDDLAADAGGAAVRAWGHAPSVGRRMPHAGPGTGF
jgi:hypothetical protein